MKTTFYLTLLSMHDLLLLIHGLMQIGLVIGALVLVSAWPGRASAASAAAAVIQQCSLLLAGLVGAATANGYVHMRHDLPDTDEGDSDSEVKPLFNIDGTPMFGDFDANGNPYGLTGSPFDRSASDDTWSLFDY